MRTLKADEIECRVAQVSAKGCSLLLYKTARTDATILTETYGELWQNDFKVIDGKMYGGIGIWNKELNQWIWRWDCGVESNTEAEKGQASDAFKRAGFKFLLGQELYKAPFIFIQCETVKNGNKHELVNKYVKYHVSYITYAENGDIDKLIIQNDKNEQVFYYGFKPSEKKIKPQEKDDMAYYDAISKIDNRDALISYYELNKKNVNNQKTFHEMVVMRAEAIKELNKEVA
jgi:hypothetical protein